eukprot:COSAG02_NODE_14260_length_1292_cov_1.299246_1_plen_166_part_00
MRTYCSIPYEQSGSCVRYLRRRPNGHHSGHRVPSSVWHRMRRSYRACFSRCGPPNLCCFNLCFMTIREKSYNRSDRHISQVAHTHLPSGGVHVETATRLHRSDRWSCRSWRISIRFAALLNFPRGIEPIIGTDRHLWCVIYRKMVRITYFRLSIGYPLWCGVRGI